MGRTPDAQYNVAAPDSLAVRIAGRMRRRIFERFLEVSRVSDDDTVLDVGVTSDRRHEHSNYFEHWYPWPHRITAAGVDHAAFLTEIDPRLHFLYADGRELPFADGSFDWVHSAAVIEHVGSRANQRRFIGELTRVTRRGVFVTTPNRWHPVEVHTLVPLAHWLPPSIFRHLLRAVGMPFFAREENLNLLSRRALLQLCGEAGIGGAEVRSTRLWGWPSNLLLVIRRGAAA